MKQCAVFMYDNIEDFMISGKLQQWKAYMQHLRQLCEEYNISRYRQDNFTLPNGDEVRIGTKTDGAATAG